MIEVPVSVGEVLDKISILEIKAERISDPVKVANVRRELVALCEAAAAVRMPALEAELTAVNAQLWDVEDALREAEQAQAFNAAFITLARSVYRLNDHRAALKRQINAATGSLLVEEKSYV